MCYFCVCDLWVFFEFDGDVLEIDVEDVYVGCDVFLK